MISNQLLTRCTALYGLAVIASGLARYYLQPDGEKGLWFGLAMGSLALVAALLLFFRAEILGRILASLAVLFVGGWFAYELSGKIGSGRAEIRMFAVLALTLLQAIVLVLPKRKAPHPAPR